MLLKAHHHPRRQARGSRRVAGGGNIIHAEGETLEIGPLRYKVSGASSGRGWAIISLDIFRESL